MLHGLPDSAANENREQWLQRVHPEDRCWVEKYYADALANPQGGYKMEYRIVRPSDGEVRWIRAVAEFECDANGRPLRMFGAHSDITDRKNAERDARESEERLRAIADALPLLISYIDSNQVFRFANKPYEAWFGRPLNEIVGRRARDVMDQAMYEARRPFLERALAGETVSYEAEFPLLGRPAFTEITHVPHRDDAGRSVGVYTVVQDITSRKLAERVISESEERFRSIANSAPVPIWVSRMDGLREFVNRAYHEFLGVSRGRPKISTGERRSIPTTCCGSSPSSAPEKARPSRSRWRRAIAVMTASGAGCARNRSRAGARTASTSASSAWPTTSRRRRKPSRR